MDGLNSCLSMSDIINENVETSDSCVVSELSESTQLVLIPEPIQSVPGQIILIPDPIQTISGVLDNLPPELLIPIIEMLDDASLTSLYLSSTMFYSHIKLPSTVRGKGVCLECIKSESITLFRYWFLKVRVPISDKEDFITSVVCQAAEIRGGTRPGMKAKSFIQKLLSIIWFEKWFLNTKVLHFDPLKVCVAAAKLDDPVHYTAITKSMNDLSGNRMQILTRCIWSGYLNIAEMLSKPRDFDNTDTIMRVLSKITESRVARWVIKKYTEGDARDVTEMSLVWTTLFEIGCRWGILEFIDVLLDESVFPDYESVRDMHIENRHWKRDDKKAVMFVRAFIARQPSMTITDLTLMKILPLLKDGDVNSGVIVGLINKHYTARDIHNIALESRVHVIVYSACRLFPVEYDVGMTVVLLGIMTTKKEKPSVLSYCKFSADAIKGALAILWEDFCDYPNKKLYIVSILLSTKFITSLEATEYLSSIYQHYTIVEEPRREPCHHVLSECTCESNFLIDEDSDANVVD